MAHSDRVSTGLLPWFRFGLESNAGSSVVATVNRVETTKPFSGEFVRGEYPRQSPWEDGFYFPECESSDAQRVRAVRRRDRRERVSLFGRKSRDREIFATTGKILHESKVSFTERFLGAYLVANDKPGIAAITLAENLGVLYLPYGWELGELCKAKSERDSDYSLDEKVWLDERCLGVIDPREGKQGRETDQTTVTIGASLYSGSPQHCLMGVVADATTTVLDVLEGSVSPKITLETDGTPSYGACAKEMDTTHTVTLSSDESAHEVFKWVNTPVSHTKRFIDGTCHNGGECKPALK